MLLLIAYYAVATKAIDAMMAIDWPAAGHAIVLADAIDTAYGRHAMILLLSAGHINTLIRQILFALLRISLRHYADIIATIIDNISLSLLMPLRFFFHCIIAFFAISHIIID